MQAATPSRVWVHPLSQTSCALERSATSPLSPAPTTATTAKPAEVSTVATSFAAKASRLPPRASTVREIVPCEKSRVTIIAPAIAEKSSSIIQARTTWPVTAPEPGGSGILTPST